MMHDDKAIWFVFIFFRFFLFETLHTDGKNFGWSQTSLWWPYLEVSFRYAA